jgi:hypothetical protein
MDNPVVLAIAELAVQRKRETKERAKRSDKIIRQLSALAGTIVLAMHPLNLPL